MILRCKEYDVRGNWYAPEHFLLSYKSVIGCDLIDTTSSAGDWSGLFYQKIGNTIKVIPFTQENSGDGFIVYTGDVLCSVPERLFDKNAIISEYCEMIY